MNAFTDDIKFDAKIMEPRPRIDCNLFAQHRNNDYS